MAKPTIEPITEQTLPEFAAFLVENMSYKRSLEDWVAGLRTSWGCVPPNYGFVMRDGGRIVGGIGAIYAKRLIRGREENFCNITSWCVLDSHRKYSMQLAMHVVGQPDFHFTDFSPTKVVAGALQFLKFKSLDEGVVVLPNLPLAPGPGKVVAAPEEIARKLSGHLAEAWRDHASFAWLNHVLVGDGETWCYMVYKRKVFKGLPCASVIYVSDKELLDKYLNCLTRHLFWRGVFSTHIERRMLGRLPLISKLRTGFNPKQYLSSTLHDSDIDYLYSETVALDL